MIEEVQLRAKKAMAKPSQRRGFLTAGAVVDLGDAWAGNSVNCVPYRVDGLHTEGGSRFTAFYDPQGDVQVVRQDLSDGSLVRTRISNGRKPYDAHQSISLGVDPVGRVHLAFGAHNSSLLATCSATSDLRKGFPQPTEVVANATYPMFLRLPQQEFALLYRQGPHFAGEIRLRRQVAGASEWQAPEPSLISGVEQPPSSGPYLNTPLVDEAGVVHFFLVWRLKGTATSAGAVVNVGVDYLRSEDGLRSLSTLRGVKLSAPVTPLVSERVVAVPLGSSLINQSSAALMPSGKPAFLTYWDAGDGIPQYRLGWHTEGGWRVSQVSDFTTPFRLDGAGTLPLPHSRPELLPRSDGRIIVVYRSVEQGGMLTAMELRPPHYNWRKARRQTLLREDLGFYEPVIDRAAWQQRGEIVLYVQRCRQLADRDGKEDLETAPAKLMTWHPND